MYSIISKTLPQFSYYNRPCLHHISLPVAGFPPVAAFQPKLHDLDLNYSLSTVVAAPPSVRIDPPSCVILLFQPLAAGIIQIRQNRLKNKDVHKKDRYAVMYVYLQSSRKELQECNLSVSILITYMYSHIHPKWYISEVIP